MTLELTVPLRIAEFRKRGAPTHWERDRAHLWATTDLLAKGDLLLYKSEVKGESAFQMANLIHALAVLAFQPGGVSFGRLHFEALAAKEGN